MRQMQRQPEFAEEVKKRAIIAMFSDDELMERLVLEGRESSRYCVRGIGACVP
jgi:hypothetical protein